jgi:hypothetical protein
MQNTPGSFGISGQVISHSNRKAKIKWESDGTDVTHINNTYVSVLKGRDPRYVPMHLNLDFFKLKPCPQSSTHNHKNCPYYHNNKDRKRPNNFYSAELCSFAEKNQECPYGDSCSQSHNRVEQLVFIIFGLS